jgi:hypothetical protein
MKGIVGAAGKREAMAVRRVQVLDLRIAGGSMRSIARTLGVTHGTVVRDLQAALADLREQQDQRAADYKTLLLERHERNYLKLHTQLEAGHLGASDRALRIMQEEAKLLGLYAPELHAQTTKAGDDLPPLSDLMERFAHARHRQEDSEAQ